jgi:hypothetical protein
MKPPNHNEVDGAALAPRMVVTREGLQQDWGRDSCRSFFWRDCDFLTECRRRAREMSPDIEDRRALLQSACRICEVA